jgi:hypothetical protein
VLDFAQSPAAAREAPSRTPAGIAGGESAGNAGEGFHLPKVNRTGLITYSLGAVLAVIAVEFWFSLWAAREAAEGEHTSVARAVLTAL